MRTSSPAWLWLAAAVSLIAGFVLVMKDSSAGWFLIIMGIVDIGAAARGGSVLAASGRGMVRWGLIAVTLLLVLLVLITGAVFLIK